MSRWQLGRRISDSRQPLSLISSISVTPMNLEPFITPGVTQLHPKSKLRPLPCQPKSLAGCAVGPQLPQHRLPFVWSFGKSWWEDKNDAQACFTAANWKPRGGRGFWAGCNQAPRHQQGKAGPQEMVTRAAPCHCNVNLSGHGAPRGTGWAGRDEQGVGDTMHGVGTPPPA